MQNSRAFTLLEVILALVILVSAVAIYSSTQFRALLRIWKGSESVSRVFLVQKELTKIFLKYPKMLDKPIVRNLEKPEVKIKTSVFDINKKSSLKKFREFVSGISSVGEWKSGPDDRRLKFVSFVLKPEKVKKS